MVGNTDAGAGGWGVARLDGNLVLDVGFNTVGWTTSSFPGPAGNGSIPLDVAIQDDRDIVAVGATGANDVGDFALARYQPTGPPDPEFSVDGDGQQTTDFSNGADQAHAVAIQPADQKIVVAGHAGPPGESRLCARPLHDRRLARPELLGTGRQADDRLRRRLVRP